ncbi:hypothetical protein ACFQZE_00580 [Paenibacillus sp. GCM10027627]|uniref:hypothetical protein n=1 Tax=unclassified Paenibacillus TaxID=185978 RepID=UPI00364439CC
MYDEIVVEMKNDNKPEGFFMGSKLFIIVNQTNKALYFVNTETSADNESVNPVIFSDLPSINVTAGQHGEGCDVPDCSAEKYYDDHHMEINLDQNDPPTNLFTFWYNDDKNDYYYSTTDSFNSSAIIPGNASSSGTKKVLYIRADNSIFLSDIKE